MHFCLYPVLNKNFVKTKNGQTNHIVSIFLFPARFWPSVLSIHSVQPNRFFCILLKNSFYQLFIKKYKSFKDNDLNMLITRIKHFISQNEIFLGKPDDSFL